MDNKALMEKLTTMRKNLVADRVKEKQYLAYVEEKGRELLSFKKRGKTWPTWKRMGKWKRKRISLLLSRIIPYSIGYRRSKLTFFPMTIQLSQHTLH